MTQLFGFDAMFSLDNDKKVASSVTTHVAFRDIGQRDQIVYSAHFTALSNWASTCAKVSAMDLS